MREDLHRLREQLGEDVFSKHVPRLIDWGFAQRGSRKLAWEALEYVPEGSLSDLIRDEGRQGLTPARIEAIVARLVTTLDFWETNRLGRQIDLSPGNVLLRRRDPIDLVLGDFGGIKGTGPSQAFGTLQVKLAYMAPEALSHASHAKSPYWSLGKIVFEMIRGPEASTSSDTARLLLATTEVDVSGITDERQRTLVAGLLTRNPEQRWGAPEIRRWLRHERVPVHRALPQNALAHNHAQPQFARISETLKLDPLVREALVQRTKDAGAWVSTQAGSAWAGVRRLGSHGRPNLGRLAVDRTRRYQVSLRVRALLWWSFLISCIEPTYLLVAKRQGLPKNPAIMAEGERFMSSISAYTQVLPDFLTPVLRALIDGPAWKPLLAYPLILAVCIVINRRSTRGAGTNSWLSRPASLIGSFFALGLLLHLLAVNLRPFWVALATMSMGLFVVLAVLAGALRFVAGPARTRRPAQEQPRPTLRP
ncbi:hypothetical protein GCM10027456_11730 [Kineosporia babensis]